MPGLSTLNVSIPVYLTDCEALALAQFVKRLGWTEFRACAVDDDEAESIRSAVGQLQLVLAELGYSPR
jgi:hypothetical protein